MTTSEVRPYVRQEMRAWLATLPPDAPFCLPCCCPITTYMQRHGWIGALQYDNRAAENADRALATAIDKLPGYTVFPGTWAHLTPRQVIAAIDELEARAA